MRTNKYCGNCKHFKDEDAVGWGRCVGHMKEFGVHSSHIGCLGYKFVKNTINGWIEITPDNVDDIYNLAESRFVDVLDSRTMVVKGVNDWHCTLSTMSNMGGYYYYVLPELELDNEDRNRK